MKTNDVQNNVQYEQPTVPNQIEESSAHFELFDLYLDSPNEPIETLPILLWISILKQCCISVGYSQNPVPFIKQFTEDRRGWQNQRTWTPTEKELNADSTNGS